MDKDITVKWQYSSGQDYEYTFDDSSKAGELFRLKVLEKGIKQVQVWLGDFLVIESNKPEED